MGGWIDGWTVEKEKISLAFPDEALFHILVSFSGNSWVRVRVSVNEDNLMQIQIKIQI